MILNVVFTQGVIFDTINEWIRPISLASSRKSLMFFHFNSIKLIFSLFLSDEVCFVQHYKKQWKCAAVSNF